MSQDWHHTLRGAPAAAPVSAAQLKHLAVSGQLRRDDLVWRPGMADWVIADTIKDLFTPAPAAAPPPAPAKPPPPVPAGEPKELHPLLVLALTALTLGGFGIYYVLSVSARTSRLAAARAADAAGRPLGKVRHPAGILLLFYLTLGFYFPYWVYRALLETAAYTGRTDLRPRAELALMLVCPGYAVYVAVFRLPELVKKAQATAGLPENLLVGPAYLFLNPFMWPGLPFVAALFQDALNQVWLNAPEPPRQPVE